MKYFFCEIMFKNEKMEALTKSYIKSVLTRLSGLDLLSGSVSECMCKLYGIDTLLPDCEVELPGCHGLHRKHGLYLQCCSELYEGDLCKKCTTKASNSSYGKPPHGLIEERRGKGPSYIAPDGSKAVSFANVVEELGINLEDAKYYAESLGWVIPESELVYKEKKRGRPKKEKEENNEPAKKRGRPKKEEIIKTQDDLIAEMASQLEIDYNSTNENNINDEKEKKKAEKKRLKEEKEVESIKSKNVDIDIQSKLVSFISQNSNESNTGVKKDESKDEFNSKENNLVDGNKMELAEGFYGIFKTINGVQYIITDGFPGDDEAEIVKIVWKCDDDREVESIGELLEGGEIELFD